MSDGDLLDELRRAGEADSEGGFTLDAESARRKLGEFRLASPAHWLLPVVAHAVSSGASRVRLSYDMAQWRMSHDGATLSREDLERLHLVDALSMPPHLSHLAAAVDALMALRLEASVESGRWRLRLSQKGGGIEETREDLPGVGLDVLLPDDRSNFARALQVMMSGFQHEERLLREHCRYAPIEVSVNDRRLSLQAMPSDGVLIYRTLGTPRVEPPVCEHVRTADLCGFDAALLAGLEKGRLVLVVDGLAFDQADPLFEESGVLCVAWAPMLGVDLSYGRVVRDEAWEDVNARLRAALDDVMLDLANVSDGVPRQHFDLVRRRLVAAEERFERQGNAAAVARIRAGLLGVFAPSMSSADAAHARKLLASADFGGPRARVLERFEEMVFELFEEEGAAWQTKLHEVALDRLRADGPSAGLVRAQHRAVVRMARGTQPELALPFARQAREAAFAVECDDSLRAAACDVEALALRCAQKNSAAGRLHDQAAGLRDSDPIGQARSAVLVAEVKIARLQHDQAMWLLRRARGLFEASALEDHREVCAELARLLWLRGHPDQAREPADCAASRTRDEHPAFLADRVQLARALHAADSAPTLHGLVRWILNPGPREPLLSYSAMLQRQMERLEKYFAEPREAARVADALSQDFLTIDRQQPFTPLWTVVARRLVFALRLDNRWIEADALLARVRLCIGLWPLDPHAGVLTKRW